MKKFVPVVGLLSWLFFGGASPVAAQTLMSNSTTPVILKHSNKTLTVDQNVSLNVTGTNAVSFSDSTNGDALTVTNSGTIEQTGSSAGGNSGYAMVDANGNTTITITNNATGTIETTDDDTIHMSQKSNNVTVNNYGLIDSMNISGTSNQAVNLNKITSGTNIVNNYAGGTIEVYESDAVRPGVNGYVYNDGTIKSTNGVGNTSSSDGIDGQNNNNITIVNGNAIMGDSTGADLIEGARHGITGANITSNAGSDLGGYQDTGSYTMTVTNNAGATIQGDNGSGINIDGVGLQGSGSSLYTNQLVNVTNYGTISGDGVTHDGDGIDVDGDVIITNSGTIVSKNAVPEAGSPAGSVEFSEGITVGGGSITNLAGGVIEGEVAGTNTQAVGRGITLGGIDHDFNDNSFPIESIYENSTITNSGLIKGDSESGIAVLGTTGGTYLVTIINNAGGTIEGNNTGVSEDSMFTSGSYSGSYSGQSQNQAAIELDDAGNSYAITNSGTITQDNTSGGTAVAMHGTSNTLTIQGGSASIVGNVSGNTAANSTLTINPGAGNSFSYGYNISNFTVQINSDGTNGTVILSGSNSYTGNTTIQGGTLLAENTAAGSSATGSGSVSVTAGKLGGFGTLNPTGTNTINVSSGGTLAPGTTGHTDTLTVSAANNTNTSGMVGLAGAGLTFNLNVGLASSSLSLTGAFTNEVTGLSGNTFTFNDLSSGHLSLGDYTLISTDQSNPADDPFSGLSTGVQTGFTLNGLSAYTTAGETVELAVNQIGSNNAYALQLEIVPEPSTWAMMVVGGVMLVFVVRRQRMPVRS